MKMSIGEYIEKFGFRRNGATSNHPLSIYKVPLSVINEWYDLYLKEGIEPENFSTVE